MEPAKFFSSANKHADMRCAVPGCYTKGNTSFHKFPNPNDTVNVTDYFGNHQQLNKLQAWKNAVRLSDISGYSRICSLHFKKNDYLSPDFDVSRRVLRKNKIPTMNLPGKNEKKEKLGLARHRRLQNRTKNKSDFPKNKLKTKCNNKLKNDEIKSVILEINSVPEKLIENINNKVNSEFDKNAVINCVNEERSYIEVVEKKDFEKQEEKQSLLKTEQKDSLKNKHFSESCQCTGILVEQPLSIELNKIDSANDSITQEYIGKTKTPSFVKEIITDAQLSTATGLQSFKLLQNIVDAVKLVVGDRYEKKTFILNTFNRVFLTYVKLKQNLSYSFLALLFNCVSERHCQRIFIETVQILSKVLSVAIPWPERQEIRKNIPRCFIGFEDVRVVLDCTEIFIERPENDCCQVLTYSHYKGHYTVKFLTGVTPAGDISYVSRVYGGKAGDSAIFEQSELVKLLEPEDAIMVDRGFHINEICKKNKWKVIRPPDVKKKQPFTKVEAVNTTAIAKARVHIERSNQRIKVFQMMHSTLPASLLPIAEDIFRIVCATVNLSAPILKKDKFLTV